MCDFNMKDTLQGLLKALGIAQDKLAVEITKNLRKKTEQEADWSATKLCGKINRRSMTAEEFVDILDITGIDIMFYNRNTKRFVLPAKAGMFGKERKIRASYDGKMYYTKDSCPICNDSSTEIKWNEGYHSELFINPDNEFFFALYDERSASLDRVRSVTDSEAIEFMAKFLKDEKLKRFVDVILDNKPNGLLFGTGTI